MVDLTLIAYIVLNVLHICANVLQFTFAYFLSDNLTFDYVPPQWEDGISHNWNTAVALMVFACLMMVICIFNLAIIKRNDLYRVVAGILTVALLIYFILMCLCCANNKIWGYNWLISKTFSLANCFKTIYHYEPKAAITCHFIFLIVIIWWEMTLQFCIIFAAILLDNFKNFGIRPNNMYSSTPYMVYYPPPVVYTPYSPNYVAYSPPPPSGYPQPMQPYQTALQYDAGKEGQLPQQKPS